MAIEQTLVGLERNFAGRACTLSRATSRDNQIDDDESSWLLLASPFAVSSMRVHNRAPGETRINTEAARSAIQASLEAQLPGNARLTRDVSIGAMYTDDLPPSGQAYSNVFVVVGYEFELDVRLADPRISVELYFGWRRQGTTMSLAPAWHHHVDVNDVVGFRARGFKSAVESALTTAAPGGSSPGDQIRDGLSLLFDQTGVRNWYVIPGDGARNSQDSDISVRRDASFFIVQ